MATLHTSEGIVIRILAGDTSAETEMIKLYAESLFCILLRQCGDEELAKDITQETWRIVIEKIRSNQLREPKKLSGFIIQCGKNQVIMHFRKSETKRCVSNNSERICAVLESTDSNKPACLDPEEALLKYNFAITIRRLILELAKQRDRELITRFFINEQEKIDICEALNLKANHFDRVIYRAKRRFKSIWLDHEKVS